MIRAMLALEWQYARHNATAVVRSPLRLALWIPYLASIAIFSFLRFSSGRHHDGPLSATLGTQTATAFAGFYLALLGITIAVSAAGRVRSFRCLAEAVLMSNAGMRPLSIALWLQLRKIALGWTRALGGLLYAFVIFPTRGDPGELARTFGATILFFAVAMSADLPAFLLARGRANALVRAAGWTLAGVGASYALAGFGGVRLWRPIVGATHVDPGAVVRAIAAGNWIALLVPFAVFAGFVAIVAARGDDALPELYAAAQFGSRERLRTANADRLPDSAHVRVPPGPLALVWKDWVAFRRGRGTRLLLAGACFWALCGAVAAFAARRFDDATPLATFAVFEVVIVVFWAPATAATGLANDLGKPLFWLARSSLRARLFAWTLGRAWRGALALALGPLAAALVLRSPAFALLAVPLTFVAFWSLQTLGVGLYAAFPNPIDARGPLGLVRLFASIAYLVVPGLLGLVGATTHGGPLVAALAFAVGLTLEAWGVLELAANRFASHGASLATLARAT